MCVCVFAPVCLTDCLSVCLSVCLRVCVQSICICCVCLYYEGAITETGGKFLNKRIRSELAKNGNSASSKLELAKKGNYAS